MHLLGEQEEQLLVHLGRRTEDAFDVGVAVGLSVAVGQVKGVDDLALVARGDAGLAEDLHHAGEGVDITLHHHRGDRNTGILGQAVTGAQLLRKLRVMRLAPGEQEVFREGHAGGRVTAGDLDDPIGGHLEIGAHDNGAGETGVETVAQIGRQGRVPLTRGGEQEHLFRIDFAGAVAADASAARHARLAAEGILYLSHPRFGHQREDLLPRLGAGVGILRDKVGQDGLGAEVVDPLRSGGVRLVLDLTRKPADDLEGGLGLGLHQVGERAAQDGRRDLGKHAEHFTGSFALLPIVDLLLGTEDGHVVVPDARDLVALGELGGLFGGEEGGDFLTEAFIGHLVEVGTIGEVSLGEIAEATGEQDTTRGEATGGILATELLGTA